MKIVSNIVGGLLGLLFIFASSVVLFNLMPQPPAPPEGSAAYHFMNAFFPTGYMTFIKGLELTGGILVAIPKTRNFGLLILGPIIINIIAYHAFVMKGEGLAGTAVVGVPALYLLCAAHRQFLNLKN